MVFVNKRNTTHGGLTYVLYELEISIRIKKNWKYCTEFKIMYDLRLKITP